MEDEGDEAVDLKIAGKRALVLGGNRGMGLAIARALAAEGAKISIAARDVSALAVAASTIGDARTFQLDLAEGASFPAFAEAVGEIDILIAHRFEPADLVKHVRRDGITVALFHRLSFRVSSLFERL